MLAPIGYPPPCAGDFSPNSQATQAEQERPSAFDGKQRKPNEMLDKKLTNCRC
jgi:hypothetical protein